MSKPTKIDRKLLRTPDSFILKGRALLDFLADQRMLLVFGVIAVVVLVGGVEGYQWWFHERIEKAWVAYNEAKKAPEPQRWDKLQAMVEEWGVMRPTYFAQVELGDHFYKDAETDLAKPANSIAGTIKTEDAANGNAVKASEWYTKALAFKGLVPGERQLLLIDRGESYELQNKFDLALQDYQAAGAISADANGYALLSEGRAWELKKDPTKAVAAYQRVVAEFSSTEYAKMAKNYLRLMKSAIFQNDKT